MIDGIKQKPISDIKRKPTPLRAEEFRFVPEIKPTHRIEENPFLKTERREKTHLIEENPRQPFRPKLLLLVAGILVLLALGFLAIDHFSSATISIVPVTQSAHLDSDFTATKGTTVSGDLALQFMSLSEEGTKEVKGTVEQNIQKKASGKATIYNFYSEASQRLIKNTRLESPDHKIFRINDSVVVPGAKIVGGKVTQPGSVVVSIYADAPGKEYNIGLSDFVIPGFKGDPKYLKFTARSNVEAPLSGGFSGTMEVPSPEDTLKAKNDIKEELKKTILEKASAQIPKDFSFFPGSVVLKFEEKPEELVVGENEKIIISATASVFFFDTAVLTKKIAENALPKYTGSTLSISNLKNLSFTFVDKVDDVVLADLAKVRFHITGDAIFVGEINTEELSANLAGKDKTDFTKIISKQNSIERANVSMFPPWKNSFPVDSGKIYVKLVSE
ncbi:MAG: hypothetical protein PHS95_00460 [Candidatus Pacebacteria bacterium]|nr:hypothetical protein [Candidatus Paceibacterota bacterium]